MMLCTVLIVLSTHLFVLILVAAKSGHTWGVPWPDSRQDVYLPEDPQVQTQYRKPVSKEFRNSCVVCELLIQSAEI